MNNTIVKLVVPEHFQQTFIKKTHLRFENTTDPYDHQPAYVDLNLFPKSHITQQQGAGFMDKYISWCEGFQTQVITAEETKFNDYISYEVQMRTDAVFQEKHFKINYFNSCILLDDYWCLEFQFVYETKVEAIYKPLVTSTFQSLEVVGKASDWQAAYSADVAETDSAYQESLVRQADLAQDTIEVAPFEIPKDGQDYIKIGNFDFAFIEEGCKWNTVEFSQRFYVQIQASISKIPQAQEAQLIDTDYQLELGEIQFSFDCGAIYQKGIPTGQFTFEEGKTGAPQHLYVRFRGISMLDFYGNVTLQQGWLGVNGILKKSYQDQPSFDVRIYKKMPIESIDWSLYRFTLEEALQIQPEIVQYLWVNEYYKPEFPKAILAFSQLKQLTIQSHINTVQGTVISLKQVAEEIGELIHLTQLSICNTSIEFLPNTIGQLKELEQLHLSNNQLARLPDSIFQLPKLKYLWVQRNQLTNIPEEINLPALLQADFSHNQLLTLPERLAQQANLNKLNLQNNPWQSLPEAFNSITSIELDIDEKRRLLSYDYMGADGKGTIVWNNEKYVALNDPFLTTLLRDALKNTVLEKYQSPLEKLALKAVCIKTTEADKYTKIGNTRFGGLPDLPAGESYPQWHYAYREEEQDYHYIFIAQLNCEELAPYQDYLPRKGILYFYLEDEESFACKVMYYPDTEKLQSAKILDRKSIDIFDMEEPYAAFKTGFSPLVALPSFYSDSYWYNLVEAPELEALEDYDHEDYETFTETLREEVSKALGKKGRYQEWNNTFYADSHHSINDYVFTQHESPQEQAALKYKGNPEDWIVLLKVYSDHNCGFCFWDAGELFFVIHKSDLAKGDFSKVYASIETS